MMGPDILLVDDVGLRRAMSLRNNSGKPPSELKVRQIAGAWPPGRTEATWLPAAIARYDFGRIPAGEAIGERGTGVCQAIPALRLTPYASPSFPSSRRRVRCIRLLPSLD